MLLLCHIWPQDKPNQTKPNQTKFGTDKMTVSGKFWVFVLHGT